MYKVTSIIGTRPELIRMSRILEKFDLFFNHRIVHTGQNPDKELKEVFFNELGIRKPDLELDIRDQNLGDSLAKLFSSVGKELTVNRPDAIVILGDTNSALSGLLARRFKIPFYHLEAGLRSFDKNVPEEINRRMIDHTADFNLVYTEHARRNLIQEGLHPRTIGLIGSPMKEIIDANMPAILRSDVLTRLELESGHYFLVSLHRQENVDDPERLKAILAKLNRLARDTDFPVIVSTHPRTRQKLAEFKLNYSENLRMCSPFGFNDFCKLQIKAKMVLSDSGSISEEASVLGIKALTIRDSMERPEALESGNILLSAVTPENLNEHILMTSDLPLAKHTPWEYAIEDTSSRVVKFIVSTLPQYRFWFGIR